MITGAESLRSIRRFKVKLKKYQINKHMLAFLLSLFSYVSVKRSNNNRQQTSKTTFRPGITAEMNTT